MILEGRVQVLVGNEKMTFEGGPFTCFGAEFLMSDQGYDGSIFLALFLPAFIVLKQSLPVVDYCLNVLRGKSL